MKQSHPEQQGEDGAQETLRLDRGGGDRMTTMLPRLPLSLGKKESVQLTLEQHEFKLSGSTLMWVF